MNNNPLDEAKQSADLLAKAADISLDPHLSGAQKNLETVNLITRETLVEWSMPEIQDFLGKRNRIVRARTMEPLPRREED